MANDYGKPDRGPSFEETNFRSALEGMGHEVVAFDFMERARVAGKPQMRRQLVAAAAETGHDVALFCLFTHEIDPETVAAARHEGGGPAGNWFAGHHWRLDSFNPHVAPAVPLGGAP